MRQIPLTQGKIALVSNQDYWLVRQFKWCAAQHKSGNWYAQMGIIGTTISMHRLLAGFPPFALDHRNGNGLDNRRRNLRPASTRENAMNKKCPRNNAAGIKGVSFIAWRKRWRAMIHVHPRNIFLGYFHHAEDAARAYKFAAQRYFGEFARCH